MANPRNRTMSLGQMQELKDQSYRLRVQLDALCKNVIDLFSPMDVAMTYVEQIDVKRLKIHVADIERKRRELDGVLTEIKSIADELGLEGH